MDRLYILLIEHFSAAGVDPKKTFENYGRTMVDRVEGVTQGVVQLKRYPLYEVVLIEVGQDQDLERMSLLPKEIRRMGYSGLLLLYSEEPLRCLHPAFGQGYVDGYVAKPCDFNRFSYLLDRHHKASVGLLQPKPLA